MSTFRSFSEIVATMIQRLQLTQPNLDTKPGSVSRDLFVDIPADQIARLYSAINLVSEKQSLATTSGRDLDRLASNFGTSRNTGSAANGIVVFCTNSIVADMPIPTGTLVSARNGSTYRTIGNFVMSSVDKNRLAANSSRMRKSLNIAGINARYVLEVPVQATRNGTSANVSSLQIVSTNLAEAVSVTNLTSMTGGSNNETDDSFRSRILSIFSGANIGTSTGYKNALMGVDGVIDALVVEPGDSLMLRDGTETLELDDGSSRILNSGTGGKVDAYILGRKIQEISDSFLFTDLSGSGDISDDRNDYILGQSTQDMTRTSEERRILAFKNANIPAQPVDSVVSVTGSSSGLLIEQYTDLDGNTKGNYVLEKDLNPETGGSPFGFDKISFISNTKDVIAENLTKKQNFGLDPLSFNDISEIHGVYIDINETNENSQVSVAGSQYIRLLHSPVLKVNRVINKTTGEVYSVVSQELNTDGLNEDGIIEISGRSLPSAADILSVNYVWRYIFDPYIDYAGADSVGQFSDASAADSIDWSSAGGIFEEEGVISKSQDGLIYEVLLKNNVSRVLSVYRKDVAEGQISEISLIGEESVIGVELSLDADSVENIISIKRASDGVEIYNTKYMDGSFESRVINLPSDSPGSIGDEVIINYNKIEIYDIDETDGSSYNNVITLPSDGTLDEQGLLGMVEGIYFSGETIHASYVADASSVYPETNLSSLPITSIDTTNELIALDNFDSYSSNQPIFYAFGPNGGISGIDRFGAAPLRLSVSGIAAPGKIKVSGETLTRLSIEIEAGTSLSKRLVDIRSEIKEALGLASIPDNIGVARVDRAALLGWSGRVKEEYDIFGCSLKNVDYSMGTAQLDEGLANYQFELPETPKNNLITATSGDIILLNVLIYNTDDYEEVYFDISSEKTTANRFGRVKRVSVSSGFRTGGGSLVGYIATEALNQPKFGSIYYVDYDFVAPKEGERITVSYNVNRLVIDATASVEQVRPITADILIKEADEILVDVEGSILVNDNALDEADRIVDTAISAVSNLLNTARLGAIIDYSDIVSIVASQNGVDSVNVSLFNESGKTGRRVFLRALDNQTISPGSISFEAISRNKFRIN
jgi:phage-related baseplate assembly protein